jgi:3-oxoacyl-[acyl-carrier protein] reductase
MAYELGPYGITVNCVVPGAIPDRPGANQNFDPDKRAYYVRHIPIGRAGCAEDIANAVRFFCRPDAGFISGETLLIDGAHSTYLPED